MRLRTVKDRLAVWTLCASQGPTAMCVTSVRVQRDLQPHPLARPTMLFCRECSSDLANLLHIRQSPLFEELCGLQHLQMTNMAKLLNSWPWTYELYMLRNRIATAVLNEADVLEINRTCWVSWATKEMRWLSGLYRLRGFIFGDSKDSKELEGEGETEHKME